MQMVIPGKWDWRARRIQWLFDVGGIWIVERIIFDIGRPFFGIGLFLLCGIHFSRWKSFGIFSRNFLEFS